MSCASFVPRQPAMHPAPCHTGVMRPTTYQVHQTSIHMRIYLYVMEASYYDGRCDTKVVPPQFSVILKKTLKSWQRNCGKVLRFNLLDHESKPRLMDDGMTRGHQSWSTCG
ncbi:hypothetical protein HAX54_003729, partial [Datura stramonium]|nr:hypothetical protein [Datura stramonium]